MLLSVLVDHVEQGIVVRRQYPSAPILVRDLQRRPFGRSWSGLRMGIPSRRFTGILWGRVDTQANKWATHEGVGRPLRTAAGKQYVRR